MEVNVEIFPYNEEHFHQTTEKDFDLTNHSKFDILLQSKWKNAEEKNYFRYKLDHLETKVLPGKYGFIAQLNIKRALERRKPQFISDLSMPFDSSKFNFNKIKSEEVLFKISRRKEHIIDSSTDASLSSLVIINVSPLEFCNCLLVPDPESCLPQVLTEDGLTQAIETVLLSSSPCLRVGFNSLCAFASVNHFHFHLYYLKHKLFLESVDVKRLSGDCFEIVDFPSSGFAFQLTNKNVMCVAKTVMTVVKYFVQESIAHNLFITRGDPFQQDSTRKSCGSYNAIRIYLWARKPAFGAKDDAAFNPALCELAGHLPIKNSISFEAITEEMVVSILQETCQETFLKIRDHVRNLF